MKKHKTYKEALNAGDKVGASKAKGEDSIAQLCRTLCALHRGCNPAMIYNGAIKLEISGKELARLAVEEPFMFGDLMFV